MLELTLMKEPYLQESSLKTKNIIQSRAIKNTMNLIGIWEHFLLNQKEYQMCAARRQILLLIGFPWEVRSKDPMPLKMVKTVGSITSLTLDCVSKILAKLKTTN